jgi:hypothetical protein
MRAEIDHYAVLSVSPSADEAIIRAAYRVLAKRYHPDLAAGGRAQSTDRFQLIAEAYHILGNAERRAQYDEQRNRRESDRHGVRRDADSHVAQTNRSGYRPAYEAGRSRTKGKRERSFTKRPDYALKYSTNAPHKVRIAFQWFAGFVVLVVIVNVVVTIGSDPDLPAKTLQAVHTDTPQPTSVEAPRQAALVETPQQPEMQYAAAQSIEAEQKWRAAEQEREEHERQERERQEHERQVQAQIAWVKEVERSRVQAERASAGYPSTGTTPNIPNASALEAAARKSTCTGDDGTKFSITNLYGDIDVAYKGAPPVRAKIDSQGQSMITLSKIVPSNAITIVLMKGERNGTMLILSDTSGNKPTRSIAAKCVGLAY